MSAQIAAQIAAFTPLVTLLSRFDDASRGEGSPPTLPVDALAVLLSDADASRHVELYVPRGLSRAEARRLARAAAKHYRTGVVARVLDDAACDTGPEELGRLAVDLVAPMHCHQHAGIVASDLMWLSCCGTRPRSARRALAAAAAALWLAYPEYRSLGPGLAGLSAVAALVGIEALVTMLAVLAARVGAWPLGTGAEVLATVAGPAASRRTLARAGGHRVPRQQLGGGMIDWGFREERGALETRSEAEFIRRRRRTLVRNLVAYARWRAAAAAASAGAPGAILYACAR